MADEKISVVIPCHNEEKTIKESILSFKEQSLKPFEIIVVDDYSIDKTKYVLNKIKGIKRIFNEENLGPAASRNKGAEIAKGEFIVFAEADGKYSKNYLEKIIMPLRDKNIGGVLSGKRIVWTNKKNLFVKFQNLKGEVSETFTILGKRPIIGAWAFRRLDFHNLGGYNKSYRLGEDVEFVERIKKKVGKIVYVPGTFMYHKDPDTFSKYLKDKKKRMEVKSKPKNLPKIPKGVQKKIFLKMLKKSLSEGKVLLFFSIIYFVIVPKLLTASR